jgi:hypothetical protein
MLEFLKAGTAQEELIVELKKPIAIDHASRTMAKASNGRRTVERPP